MIWIFNFQGKLLREVTKAAFYEALAKCRADGITDDQLRVAFVAIEVS